MATVTLGNIKFNWKGPYNNSTAYVVDDVVSSGGSSYVCILASTGNAVSNGTYWQIMSSAGTNGTDLTSTLTTQGDLVYRDGSGLQRLGAGTSGQVLQTGGTGANPSWTAVSSDWVKITSGTFSASASTLDLQQCFSDTYEIYKLMLHLHIGTSDNNNYPEIGFLDNSNNAMTDTYYAAGEGLYMSSGSGDARWSNNQNQDSWKQNDTNGFRLINTWQMSNQDELSQAECTFFRPNRAAKVGMFATWGASQHNYVALGSTWGMHMTTTVRKGIRVNSAGGTNFNTASKYYLYGIKA